MDKGSDVGGQSDIYTVTLFFSKCDWQTDELTDLIKNMWIKEDQTGGPHKRRQ